MTKVYTPNSPWVDELLAGTERYDLLTDAGAPINTDVQLNLSTLIVTAGTPVTADRMNNIEDGLDALDTKVDAAGLLTTAEKTDLTDGGNTTLHSHDHGAQSGLADDDHTQYHNNARGDARYLREAFPIGAVFIAVVSTDPGTLLGYGTWTAFGAGRVLVGLDAGQTEFDVIEETGGSKTHTLISAEMPAHTHSMTPGDWNYFTVAGSGSRATMQDGNNTASAGGGGAHNNLQPYIVVYMWKRTA